MKKFTLFATALLLVVAIGVVGFALAVLLNWAGFRVVGEGI